MLPGPVVGTAPWNVGGGTLQVSYKALPSGVTGYNTNWTLDHLPTNAGFGQGGLLAFFNASAAAQTTGGLFTGYNATTVTGQAQFTMVTPYPAYAAAIGWNDDNVIRTATVTIDFNCGNPGLSTPCCPPDPMVDQLLIAINGKLDQLLSLGGGAAPAPSPPFTVGTTHTGLSGNGTLVFAGAARALRVDVTSPTTSFIMNPGSPNYFFSMGFITSYANTYPLKGWRLVYTGQIYPLVPQATEVGWTLPPGLVINITELL